MCGLGAGDIIPPVTKAEFIKELAGALQVEPDTLKADVDLTALKSWDSTAVINLIVILDEQGVEVDEEKIPDCKTVQDVLDLMGDKLED